MFTGSVFLVNACSRKACCGLHFFFIFPVKFLPSFMLLFLSRLVIPVVSLLPLLCYYHLRLPLFTFFQQSFIFFPFLAHVTAVRDALVLDSVYAKKQILIWKSLSLSDAF